MMKARYLKELNSLRIPKEEFAELREFLFKSERDIF